MVTNHERFRGDYILYSEGWTVAGGNSSGDGAGMLSAFLSGISSVALPAMLLAVLSDMVLE